MSNYISAEKLLKGINHEKVSVALYGAGKLKGDYEKGKCHGLELAQDKVNELAKGEEQYQLTIPKNIAMLIDRLMWFETQSCRVLYQANSDSDWYRMNANPEYHILHKWSTKNKWANMPLIATYLNPLTRDFVNVLED